MTKLNLFQPANSFERRKGIALVWQVKSSEKGQFLSPNSGRFGVWRKDRAKPWIRRFRYWKKDQADPWFGRFQERTGQTLVRQVPRWRKGQRPTLVRRSEKGPGRTLVWSLEKTSCFLRTPNSCRFGERTGLNLGLAGSEFEKGKFLSLDSKPWQVPSSEKGLGQSLTLTPIPTLTVTLTP